MIRYRPCRSGGGVLRHLELDLSLGAVELEGDSFSIDIEEDHEKAKIQMLNDEVRKRY